MNRTVSRSWPLTVVSLMCLDVVGSAWADTLHVPRDYPTIGAAIAAARDGDEVLVADGIYSGPGNYNLSFAGKAIVVRSAGGPARCEIDCRQLGRAFLFVSGETERSVLQGFTIRNGVISNALGAGIEVQGSSPTIRDCVFVNNISEPYNGGAMHLGQGSTALVINCVMRSNRAGGGAGLFCENSAPTIVNCVIEKNTAWVGGGVLCTNSQATFVNCLFTGNDATDANWGGGAIFCNASSMPLIIGCTITANTAAGLGGALYSNKGSAPILTNGILWGNTSPQIEVSSTSGEPRVTYCDVQGGYNGIGNIDADPLFVDPSGGDYRLKAGSPCIDKGDPAFVPRPGERDLDGQKRVWDGNGDGKLIVDMGVYEFGSHRYGDLNCDGVVNNFDIDPFVLALTDPAGYKAAYPNCDIMLADCNGDGAVNNFDIDPFVDLLTK